VGEFVEGVLVAFVSVELAGAVVSGALLDSAGAGTLLVEAALVSAVMAGAGAGAALVSAGGGFEASVVSAFLLQAVNVRGRAKASATTRGDFFEKLFIGPFKARNTGS
jgi:predicted MarR family transcription regulator